MVLVALLFSDFTETDWFLSKGMLLSRRFQRLADRWNHILHNQFQPS